MTIGIYMLQFKNTDKVYIGQSVNIERRYSDHKSNMRSNTASPKLQKAYDMFGTPSLIILLDDLTKEELDINEEEAIEIFNSVSNGFNLCKTSGYSGELCGELHGSSIYSNNQIIEVFNLLFNQELSFKDIAKITDVKRGTIESISTGRGHKWIEGLYPEKYRKLMSLKYSRVDNKRTSIKDKGIKYPSIISPEGEIFSNITNIAEFARKHYLDNGHLGAVLKGKENQHKGWKLYNKQTQE